MFLGESGRLIADITETCSLEELEGYLAAIEKAFHSLKHNFLITAVEHYGFHCNFINSIKILQRNPKSYVINVGHTTKYFRLERGARQGAAMIKKTLWSFFMDGVQLPQGWSHFEEAVYFLSLSSQRILLLILLTSEG